MNKKSGIDPEQLKRWRLILGKDSQDSLGAYCEGGPDGMNLSADQCLMDEALASIYDETEGEGTGQGRSARLGGSSPRLAKWLGDIRTYFSEDVVTVIQQDAIERQGLDQFLF